jgi:RHS repeat-associated protein
MTTTKKSSGKNMFRITIASCAVLFLAISAGAYSVIEDNGVRVVHMDFSSGYSSSRNWIAGPNPQTQLKTSVAGSWIGYSFVDLRFGVYKFKALVQASGTSGAGRIDVRIGNGINGQIIGTLLVPATSNQTLTAVEIRFDQIADVQGTQDVYFTFTPAAGTGNSMTIEYMELSTFINPVLHLDPENLVPRDRPSPIIVTSDGKGIKNCYGNAYIKFSQVNLKWGIIKAGAKVGTWGDVYRGTVELWANGQDQQHGGTKIGNLYISGTNWVYSEQKSDFFGRGHGIVDLYMVFVCSSDMGPFDWFELELNGESMVHAEAENFQKDYPPSDAGHLQNTGSLTVTRPGDWIRYDNLDFKGGTFGVTFKYRQTSTLSVEARLDGPNGISLGALYQLPASLQYRTAYMPLASGIVKDVRGIHDLYLVFNGSTQPTGNALVIDWFELTLKRMPYFKYEADFVDGMVGAFIDEQGGWPNARIVGGCDDGDWLKYNKVDMQQGAIAFKAHMARDGQGYNGYIEVWAGDTTSSNIFNGTKFLGRLVSNGTGSWGTYTDQSTDLCGSSIQGASGMKDLYFRFKNNTGICNLDWFEITFEDSAAPQKLVSQSQYLGDIVYERDAANKVAYQYKNIGGDGRIVFADNSNEATWPRLCYFKDHLGSTRLVVNDAGQAVQALNYTAYGECLTLKPAAGVDETKEKFTTKELDQEGKFTGAGLSVTLTVGGGLISGERLCKAYFDNESTPSATASVSVTSLGGSTYGYSADIGITSNRTLTRLDMIIGGNCNTGNVNYCLTGLNVPLHVGKQRAITTSLHTAAEYNSCNTTTNSFYTVQAEQDVGPVGTGMGLVYFGARYYDPEIGMWISCDRARQFFSPYSYAGLSNSGYTNPILFIDHDGRYGPLEHLFSGGWGDLMVDWDNKYYHVGFLQHLFNKTDFRPSDQAVEWSNEAHAVSKDEKQLKDFINDPNVPMKYKQHAIDDAYQEGCYSGAPGSVAPDEAIVEWLGARFGNTRRGKLAREWYSDNLRDLINPIGAIIKGIWLNEREMEMLGILNDPEVRKQIQEYQKIAENRIKLVPITGKTKLPPTRGPGGQPGDFY